MPLLGDTIGDNLDRTAAAQPDRRGAGRGADRAALDLRRSCAPTSTTLALRAARRPGVGEGRPGRDLGAELRGVDAGPVRHREDRRDPGQHQPGLPHPRAGVRAQPGRASRCWSRRRAFKTVRLRGDDRPRSRPSCPALRAGGAASARRSGTRCVAGGRRGDRDRAGASCRPRCRPTTRSTSSTRRAPPGFPKGATLSPPQHPEQRLLRRRAAAATPPDDRVCIPVPFYHCFGMVMGNLGVHHARRDDGHPGPGLRPGGHAAGRRSRSGARRSTACRRCSSPSSNDPDFDSYDLSSLRTGIMAGSPCPVEVMKQVVDRMGMTEVTICYGMTETSPVSTQTRRRRLAGPARVDGRAGAPARRGQDRRPGDRADRAPRRAGRAVHPRLLGDARLLGRAGEDRRGDRRGRAGCTPATSA